MWLNKNNYLDYLKGISVIEVSGNSCANCITLMPILHQIILSRNDAKLYHIEANEENIEILSRLEVDSIPSILVLYNDTVISRCRGYQPEEILELWLDAKIEEIKKIYNL